ncbi:energy transducer TonB [Pedobacter cryophilus]|uniref:TonB family protein n=1 Tax=Pedobacter cryophilus TaxID=2571271 RepID=A0A4U1CA32_9SPHI|nr:energy transducer TonB [Pedobacter cryophilus]TKC00538.1 TonB family protein [Pedobacter cryophilus]
MKKLFLLNFYILLASQIFAQEKTTYYIKEQNRPVSNLDSADYIRTIANYKNNEGLYDVFEYYKDNSKKRIGNSLKNTFSPEYSGNVLSYYKNGNKQSVENYTKGKKNGISNYFYQNGNLKKKIEFSVNEKKEEVELMIQIADSLGKNFLDETSSGRFKIIDGNNEIEGEYLNGNKNGVFKTHDFNLNEDYLDEYKNGEYIKGKTTDSSGKEIEYNKLFVLPTFKGGLQAFGKFLSKNLEYPDISRRNKTQGRVYLSFVVEKDGSLSEIKVLKGVSSEIDTEALRVLNISPNWTSGTYRSKPIRVSYTLPISFQL